MRLSSYFLIILALLASGCSLLPEKIDKTKDWSASQLYSAAKEALNDDDYQEAIDYFEKLEARYPFGTYAQQAELEIAYAYYKYDEPESAISAAQRFIKMNPRHPNVDYAWYIMGLTNYNRGRTFIDRVLPQDPSQRDTTIMHQAYDDFYQLVKQYPNSKYAADSAQRLIYLRNNMARYEMHVADYYMRRGAYIAAANRAEYVIENYQRTTSIPDALIMMVRAYRKLGMNGLADDALRVLRLNYPDNPDIPALSQGLDPKHNKGLFGWF
jgi:outer membrane protein assembly factor BamD